MQSAKKTLIKFASLFSFSNRVVGPQRFNIFTARISKAEPNFQVRLFHKRSVEKKVTQQPLPVGKSQPVFNMSRPSSSQEPSNFANLAFLIKASLFTVAVRI
jgi:hypothetical protein